MNSKIRLVWNRYDFIVTSIILISSVILLVSFFNRNTNDNLKAKVYYKDELVDTLDLSVNTIKDYQATNGNIKVEVKNKAIRVIEEKSNNNICSIQGYVKSTLTPIVCLPNEFYIELVSNVKEDVDVFIK